MPESRSIPIPDGLLSLRALRQIQRQRSVLGALEVFHAALGDIFWLRLFGFRGVMLVGPQANRFVLVDSRKGLHWRSEGDPVTRLLREGVLVVDGDRHDQLRRLMNPALHKQMLHGYVNCMLARADQMLDTWTCDSPLDMLVEMRKLALLILMDTLYGVDFSLALKQLWEAVLGHIRYISPGLWMIWPGIPRPGYRRFIQQMNDYLYQIIHLRRKIGGKPNDLLGSLIAADLEDSTIRDQLLTMLIAGHDTSTAALSWALYLLSTHPEKLAHARAEVDSVLGSQPPTVEKLNQLPYLSAVIDETLRLYPPIHLGSRRAAIDLDFNGYRLPAGTRVLYSIYLSHRHPDYWETPSEFCPERFLGRQERPAYLYLPFGGGPRNCIGAAFGQVEIKVVLARILQLFDLKYAGARVHAWMGATLEPHPGVLLNLTKRAPRGVGHTISTNPGHIRG